MSKNDSVSSVLFKPFLKLKIKKLVVVMHKLIIYLRNGLNLASNDVESNKRANNRSYCDLLSMRTNTIYKTIIN